MSVETVDEGVDETVDEGVEIVDDNAYTGGTELVKADEGFFKSTGTLQKPGQAQSKTPWIGFFSVKTNAGKDNLLAAGVEVNQFYVHDVAGPLKIKPFKYHLLKASRYYTKTDKTGKVIEAAYNDPDKGNPQGKFREQLVALVLVSYKGTMGEVILIPATWSVRGGLCKALNKAIELTSPNGAAVDQSKWAARSTQHAVAAQARFPGGRFSVSAWGSSEPRQDREYDYNLGHSQIGVTTPEEVKAFNDLTFGTEFATKIVPATQSWAYRCQQIEKLIPKS